LGKPTYFYHPGFRAFGLENQFVTQSEKLVDANHVCYYPSIITNRWLAVWLENLGNLV
jgi:hypothetical protein